MTRVVVGPFSRVEGDLEVALDVEDGAVRSARVTATSFRGFERILEGKAPPDALAVVPRVCGICSVAHSAAAAAALASAAGAEPPENGRRAIDMMLAAENAADHLLHFYAFFMPDFARPEYERRGWHGRVERRFRLAGGSGTADAIAARARFLEVMGVLAGKWPHSLALQPGGTTRPVQEAEKLQLWTQLRAFRRFLERTLYGDALERVAALDGAAALEAWCAERPGAPGDLRLFLEVARDLGLERLGRASDVFLSYGAYPSAGTAGFASGVFERGERRPLDPGAIREDASHAWLADDVPRHPTDGATLPSAEKPGAYTWCKAPRLAGRVAEVGALARQVVDGHPLARDLVARAGGNVLSRVVGRLLELALLVPALERWALALDPRAPFCTGVTLPADCAGTGLIEAARGALGHWMTVRGGRIHAYQIVAPTTWNFSPRDEAGTPGALEQALEGTPHGGGEAAVRVQHVVRSFDPCMACTVH